MAEGARIAQDLGADIIDINMGCPAREVTGALSGSALMRDLDHAERLIAATVGAARVPVTLKMRLGWDDALRNAPDLARRAEQAGVAMVTVHGRTRCQFYKGRADWRAIKDVKSAISIPLIANGDGVALGDLQTNVAPVRCRWRHGRPRRLRPAMDHRRVCPATRSRVGNRTVIIVWPVRRHQAALRGYPFVLRRRARRQDRPESISGGMSAAGSSAV